MEKLPELTSEHKKWIELLERDFPKMPLGFAKAMVEHYLMDPAYFEPAHIEQVMREAPKPQLERNECTMEIVKGEAAEKLMQQMPQQEVELVPLEQK